MCYLSLSIEQRSLEEFAQKTPTTLVRLYGLRTYGTLVETTVGLHGQS